jgi:hypothetical protein
MTKQQTMEKKDFTPEQMLLFKDLLYYTNEVTTDTFIPFALFNREKVISDLRMAKSKIEQLEKVL